MEAASFDTSNVVLGRPEGMSSEECTPLSVKRHVRGNHVMVTSCWKLTVEELAEVNRTGRIWLTVLGPTMPPVILDGIRAEDV